MSGKICAIIGAGEQKNNLKLLKKCDIVIASDGGYRYLNKINLNPTLFVGDLDSCDFQPQNCMVKKLKVEKDETDTFVCIQEGINLGATDFLLLACTGGRFDHTLANFQSLIYLARRDFNGFLFDGEQVITVISEKMSVKFTEEAKGTISVFASEKIANGVNILGLKYELNDGILSSDFPLGVSNSFIGKESEIYVSNGYLTIVFPTLCLEENLISIIKK